MPKLSPNIVVPSEAVSIVGIWEHGEHEAESALPRLERQQVHEREKIDNTSSNTKNNSAIKVRDSVEVNTVKTVNMSTNMSAKKKIGQDHIKRRSVAHRRMSLNKNTKISRNLTVE